MDAIMAGVYISACIAVAFGCFYATKYRSPLTIMILTGVGFLLLWQAGKMLFPSPQTGAYVIVQSAEKRASEQTIVNLEMAPQATVVSINIESQQVGNSAQVASSLEQTGTQVQVWPSIARWQSVIEQAAAACGVDPLLIAAVMRQESVGDPVICSKAGACGLMQLMPATAAQMGVADRFDPAQNMRGGACYLRQQLDRYGNDLTKALAAYNAGPGNVDKYRGVPPFAETQQYVKNVSAFYAQLTQKAKPAQPAEPVGAKEAGDNKLVWPVSGRITQQPSAGHMALDIAATLGTPVVSAYAGRVSAVGWAGDYGKRVIVDHGNGLQTLYAHFSSYTVKEGDQVGRGQQIGRIGSTGKSTGPHLHFEVRQNGVLKNPWNYLQGATSESTR